MKRYLLLIIVMIFVTGCGKEKVQDYHELMKKNNYIIIDVRTSSEFDENRIKNAINIPLDAINEKIPVDKDKIIFVYCQTGVRSKKAYDLLKKYGYEVYDLGSIDAIDLEKEN